MGMAKRMARAARGAVLAASLGMLAQGAQAAAAGCGAAMVEGVKMAEAKAMSKDSKLFPQMKASWMRLLSKNEGADFENPSPLLLSKIREDYVLRSKALAHPTVPTPAERAELTAGIARDQSEGTAESLGKAHYLIAWLANVDGERDLAKILVSHESKYLACMGYRE